MADERWTRREVLALTGKLTLAVGGGVLTARLLGGCEEDAGDPSPDGGGGDVATEDVAGDDAAGYDGYTVSSARGRLTARYRAAEA